VVDPMADDAAQIMFSPYHYGANNPLLFIDPDGEKVYPINDVLTLNNLDSREKQLSTGFKDLSISKMVAVGIKALLTTNDVLNVVVGAASLANESHSLFQDASNEKLIKYNETLTNLSSSLVEQENQVIKDATNMTKELEGMRDKTDLSYKHLEGKRDALIEKQGDLNDQNRAVKQEIRAVQEQLFERIKVIEN
jgi:hypothetical protein